MFPTQFRTIPGIIVWTLVFLADVALVFWAAHLLGFPILAALNKAVLMIYLVIAFALFCLESYLYNLIKH
jgi:hypothetical protein